MDTNVSATPKVFISYSWKEPIYGCDWVREFADKLRSDGIDADIDQYHDSPPEGWTTWILNQITTSDYVLVISTESYYDTVTNGRIIDSGLGRRFEGKMIQTSIYGDGCINTKFIPILPPDGSRNYILNILRDYTAYSIYGNYEKLKQRLKGQNSIKPPLGQSSLPAKEVKTLFSTLIDPYLWTNAGWCGFGCEFAKHKDQIPFLKLRFKNATESVILFKQLINRIGKGNSKEELGISFVEKENKKDLIVHIYPIYKNVVTQVENEQNIYINRGVTFSRILSINDDKTAIEIVHQLEEHYNIFNSCFLVPYACIDGEMRYAEKLKILCRNVRFRKYADISSLDDPDIAVTPELAKKPISESKQNGQL